MTRDDWMERMTAHAAITAFVDFIADSKDKSKCIAIRIKESGQIINKDDPSIEKLLGDTFKTLQDVCDYDFAKDLEACLEQEKDELQ